METFTVLLAGSAAVLRESGGSQRVQEMLGRPDCTQQALGESRERGGGGLHLSLLAWFHLRSSVARSGVKGMTDGAYRVHIQIVSGGLYALGWLLIHT